MFNRLLIAYDGSKEARKALETRMKLSAALHSETTLVTVVEPLPGYINVAGAVAPSVLEDVRQEHRRRMEQLQLDSKREAAVYGVNVQTLLVEGNETEAILDAARDAHADLLVIGLRRHAPGIEWAGTVRHIANQTPCPILAVS